MNRWLALGTRSGLLARSAALGVALALVAACGDNESATRPPARAAQATPATIATLEPYAAAEGEPRTPRNVEAGVPDTPIVLDVEVRRDGVDPEQLVLDAGVTYKAEVANESQAACTFYIGDYLADLPVPPNGEAEMGFTVPNLPGRGEGTHSTTTFGCKDAPSRTGNVVVMPRPGNVP